MPLFADPSTCTIGISLSLWPQGSSYSRHETRLGWVVFCREDNASLANLPYIVAGARFDVSPERLMNSVT